MMRWRVSVATDLAQSLHWGVVAMSCAAVVSMMDVWDKKNAYSFA